MRRLSACEESMTEETLSPCLYMTRYNGLCLGLSWASIFGGGPYIVPASENTFMTLR